MTRAYCPGHITCFFHPVRSGDVMSSGSRGVGIKTSKGAFVDVEERSDGKVVAVMDGSEQDCRVTKLVAERLAPGVGLDITIENGLPVGQGFGMSAAGAIAVGMCLCQMYDIDEKEAFIAAHVSEIEGGGGRGDVSGIMCEGAVPIRCSAGLPPWGKVIDSHLRVDLKVAVLGDPLNTGEILGNGEISKKISEIGPGCVDDFCSDMTEDNLFRLSRKFSKGTGLETCRISDVLDRLEGRSGMCMLGHSVFTTASEDEFRDAVGDVRIYGCPCTGKGPEIIRRG